MAGAVARGEGEPDRAVAEEVEGAAEGAVGGDRSRRRSRPCSSRRRGRSGRGGSRADRGRAPVAACHSSELRTKVDSGNSEIADAWSRWRWVRMTTSIVAGAEALGAELRRRRRGPARARIVSPAMRPRLWRGSEATDGCSPVSTRIAPTPGWRTRKAGTGRRQRCSRGTPIPSALSRPRRPGSCSISAGGDHGRPAAHRLDDHRGVRRRRRPAARRGGSRLL